MKKQKDDDDILFSLDDDLKDTKEVPPDKEKYD